MHGPGNSGAYASPKYARPDFVSAYPIRYWEPEWPIVIVDTVAETVGPLRLARWREIRDGAVAKWTATNLVFVVREASSTIWPENPIDPSLSADEFSWLSYAVIPYKIRLIRDPSGTQYADYAWYNATKDGGVAAQTLNPGWFEDHERQTRTRNLAHEIGHTLGFGHPEPNHETGQGIMGDANWPSDYEVAQCRAWYFGGPA